MTAIRQTRAAAGQPGAQQIPATSVNPAYWAVVQGRLAGAHPETPASGVGKGRPDQPPCSVNPHRIRDAGGRLIKTCRSRTSRALALCWDYGFAGMPRARPKPRDTVSRGTTLRPPRDDWRDHEIEVLRLARAGGQGHLSDRQLAVVVGKTHEAVRCKLTRRRRSAS
ncbi:hypothetical protein LCGC14_1015290 [marine sediment metagenome]|uniref:Uncharacterized protein n=1 Tax=marine sediment metagenome TaxID=412755 RepID=A0A0F9R520_9ZZZZ